MTLTQYLIAWSVYIFAATGCLAVWWKLTRPLNATFASWLRLWSTVAVLTPGFTSQEMTWMTPALPATLFDLLTFGPEALSRNGLILVASLLIATVIKLLFFRGSLNKKSSSKKTSENKSERSEPQVSP